MKIFVSVGSGSFDRLIEAMDRESRDRILFQIGSGTYIPKHHQYYRFKPDILSDIRWCDCVVCHAGAGTIFDGLHNKKKVVAVPNLSRTDDHQLDIVKKLSELKAIVPCFDVADIGDALRMEVKAYSVRKSAIPDVVAGFCCAAEERKLP